MKYRKYEVVGIDGELFNTLETIANKRGFNVSVLIEIYLSYCLLHDDDVMKSHYKLIEW